MKMSIPIIPKFIKEKLSYSPTSCKVMIEFDDGTEIVFCTCGSVIQNYKNENKVWFPKPTPNDNSVPGGVQCKHCKTYILVRPDYIHFGEDVYARYGNTCYIWKNESEFIPPKDALSFLVMQFIEGEWMFVCHEMLE